MITTAHFEHAAPLLAELGLDRVLEHLDRIKFGETEALKDLVEVLGQAGKLRTFRRLSAVISATVEDLLEAEADERKMQALEAAAAARPFGDTVVEIVRFFGQLAPMQGVIPASSGSAPATPESEAPADSPSGDS